VPAIVLWAAVIAADLPPDPPAASDATDDPLEGAKAESTEDPIATDRPGNGNAATVVPRLRFQVEASALFAQSDPVSSLSFPTLLRFGVTSWAELRLGTGGVGVAFADDEGAAPTDILVGTKVQLFESDGLRPDVAVMADVFLPTGSESFTQGVVVPELRAASAWALPAGFGLLLNAGVDIPRGERDARTATARFAQLLYVGNVGYTLPVLDGRPSIFVEAFGRVPFDADFAPSLHQFDFGGAFLITSNVQLDAFAQIGLNDAAPEVQLAVGASFRL